VTTTLWRLLVLAVVSSLALPIAVVVAPGERSLLVRVELLLLGGCALWAMANLVGRAAPRPPRLPLDPGPAARPIKPGPPTSLSAVNRRLRLATIHAGDAHHWVRPLIRDIAADRMALRRGLDIDPSTPAQVADVQRILGPVAWELSRRSARPDDPFAPGVPRADLEQAVTALEGI
jgi:hypothetical protein